MKSFFVILGLLLCMEAPGSSAGNHVFVEKGKDVLLEVMAADLPENFFFLSWLFNKKDVFVAFSRNGEPYVFDTYTGRVEPSLKKYSVKLKNLQESDSGVYTAQVIGVREKIGAEYNITVQAPVSPVKLTVDSVSSGSDSCNLTVTCSTQDSLHINSTFRCDTKTCSQEGGERSKVTTSAASLQVYLLYDLIICNHSNQVSWLKNMEMIEHFCHLHSVPETLSFCKVKTAVWSVGLIIMVSAVISVHLMERRKKQN